MSIGLSQPSALPASGPRPHTLCVGIGSHHGDDRVGWLVAERIADLRISGVVSRRATSPSDLMDWLDGFDRLIVCDACRGAGPIGSIHRWTWPCPSMEVRPCMSSHGLGLASALQLAGVLGRLPSEVVVWGVEVMPPQLQESLSRPVGSVVPDLVQRICRDLCHA